MNDSTFAITLVIVYILSAGYGYYWLVKAHSPKGRWSRSTIDGGDYIWILMPFLNTFVAIIGMFSSPYKKKKP